MRVDVVIVTAAEDEDRAVREVDEGGEGAWEEIAPPEGYTLPLWRRDFRGQQGRRLRVVLARAPLMGGDAAAGMAGALVQAFQPRCIAMCGVCAGRPGKTALGDVLIADRVWRYDQGEMENAVPGGKPIFRPDLLTYQLDAAWKLRAEKYHEQFVPDTAWLLTRPVPRDLLGLWVLRELLQGRDPLATPNEELRGRFRGYDPDREADPEAWRSGWGVVLDQLEREAWLTYGPDGGLALTDSGRQHLGRTLNRSGGTLPEPPAWQVRVGPIGTGNHLQRDVDIWDRLRDQQRQVLGLEMEGASIGLVQYIHGVHRLFVAKAVMDCADPAKGDAFRFWAARAAAEVTLRFLREHLEPGEKAPAEILDPFLRPAPPETNPASLLNARFAVVPFADALRRTELAILHDWCADPDPVRVRLFTGPGGAGKTRLFAEWARRLRGRGWDAGFLPETAPAEEWEILRRGTNPTFVVVDYAESRGNLRDLLRTLLLAARPPGAGPLRVALVAREAADWWRALTELDSELRAPLTREAPLPLNDAPAAGGLRAALFTEARQVLGAIRRSPWTGALPDLSDERFARVLYLHLAALADAEGRPHRPGDLLDDTVGHEQGYWRRRYDELHPTGEPLARLDFVERAARTVAALTLRGGAATADEARAVNAQAGGPTDDAEFLRFLRGLYPGTGDGGRAYLSPLEPDLLGETLVARVLGNAETPSDYVPRVFREARPESIQQGCTVFGRLEYRRQLAVDRWLDQLLSEEIEARALPALAAALSLGAETTPTGVGSALARALKGRSSPLLAQEFHTQLPRHSVSLAPVAVWVAQQLMPDQPDQPGDLEALEARARARINEAVYLGETGEREAALAAAGEATDLYRTLATARPDAFRPCLAISLNNLGGMLSDLGEREAALAAAGEAVAIYTDLARRYPQATAQNLAISVRNLMQRLQEAGLPPEGDAVLLEAVMCLVQLQSAGQ